MKFAMLLFSCFVSATSMAQGDIFAFQDLAGFEKCLQTDHLVDINKTASGEQGRFIGQGEIQGRCIAKAVKLLTPQNKNKEKLLDFIKTTKRNSAPENSLDLIEVLVNGVRSECNDMEIYGVLLASLSHPKDYPSQTNSYFNKSKKIVQICLQDKEFRKDFTEEKDNANSYLSANACEILLAEKIVKTCKKE